MTHKTKILIKFLTPSLLVILLMCSINPSNAANNPGTDQEENSIPVFHFIKDWSDDEIEEFLIAVPLLSRPSDYKIPSGPIPEIAGEHYFTGASGTSSRLIIWAHHPHNKIALVLRQTSYDERLQVGPKEVQYAFASIKYTGNFAKEMQIRLDTQLYPYQYEYFLIDMYTGMRSLGRLIDSPMRRGDIDVQSF